MVKNYMRACIRLDVEFAAIYGPILRWGTELIIIQKYTKKLHKLLRLVTQESCSFHNAHTLLLSLLQDLTTLTLRQDYTISTCWPALSARELCDRSEDTPREENCAIAGTQPFDIDIVGCQWAGKYISSPQLFVGMLWAKVEQRWWQQKGLQLCRTQWE